MGRSCSLILSTAVEQTQDHEAVHYKRKSLESLEKKKRLLEDRLTDNDILPP